MKEGPVGPVQPQGGQIEGWVIKQKMSGTPENPLPDIGRNPVRRRVAKLLAKNKKRFSGSPVWPEGGQIEGRTIKQKL